MNPQQKASYILQFLRRWDVNAGELEDRGALLQQWTSWKLQGNGISVGGPRTLPLANPDNDCCGIDWGYTNNAQVSAFYFFIQLSPDRITLEGRRYTWLPAALTSQEKATALPALGIFIQLEIILFWGFVMPWRELVFRKGGAAG